VNRTSPSLPISTTTKAPSRRQVIDPPVPLTDIGSSSVRNFSV
jgi:hypothetical protein